MLGGYTSVTAAATAVAAVAVAAAVTATVAVAAALALMSDNSVPMKCYTATLLNHCHQLLAHCNSLTPTAPASAIVLHFFSFSNRT